MKLKLYKRELIILALLSAALMVALLWLQAQRRGQADKFVVTVASDKQAQLCINNANFAQLVQAANSIQQKPAANSIQQKPAANIIQQKPAAHIIQSGTISNYNQPPAKPFVTVFDQCNWKGQSVTKGVGTYVLTGPVKPGEVPVKLGDVASFKLHPNMRIKVWYVDGSSTLLTQRPLNQPCIKNSTKKAAKFSVSVEHDVM